MQTEWEAEEVWGSPLSSRPRSNNGTAQEKLFKSRAWWSLSHGYCIILVTVYKTQGRLCSIKRLDLFSRHKINTAQVGFLDHLHYFGHFSALGLLMLYIWMNSEKTTITFFSGKMVDKAPPPDSKVSTRWSNRINSWKQRGMARATGRAETNGGRKSSLCFFYRGEVGD